MVKKYVFICRLRLTVVPLLKVQDLFFTWQTENEGGKETDRQTERERGWCERVADISSAFNPIAGVPPICRF